MELKNESRFSDQVRHQHRIRARIVERMADFVEFRQIDIQQSIAARFRQQAATHANRIAIFTDENQWTYAQVDQIANHLARRILNLCGPEPEPVILLQSQSGIHNVTVLAVLKAGKYYVPIDPSHAIEHLQAVCQSTAARLVITDPEHGDLAAQIIGAGGEVMDTAEIDFAEPTEVVEMPINANAIASVIFTSGSTGAPKGCMQTHRNVLHYVRNYSNSLRIWAGDRLSLLAGSSYSAAAMDLFAALLNGAALFPRNLAECGLSSLAYWLRERDITIYHSTATVFRCFLDSLTTRDEFPNLRIVDLGGDSTYSHDAQRFQKHFDPSCVLVVGYGTSELNVISQYLVDADTKFESGRVPIGYQSEDTEVLILDDDGQPAIAGEVGEIAVQSEYLSPGYWQQDDVTEAAYGRDPKSGSRFYRSGDLGRIQNDGCLEHLGRKSQRVKFNGRWIDLEAIETFLRKYPSIKDAFVVSHERGPGDTFLTAYYVPEEGAAPTVSALRRDLKSALPDSLVPQRFFPIEALPLTANGKLDRSYRHEGITARPRLDTIYAAPSNATETRLAEIWSDLLQLQDIGAHDDFFELGGDSLLAFRIIAQIHSAMDAEVSPRQFFESATVAKLAADIATRPGKSLSHVAPLTRRDDDRSNGVPLSFSQQRLWYLDQIEGDLTAYNLSYAWHLCSKLNIEALRRALEEIVRRHEPLRTTFSLIKGEAVQVIQAIEHLPLPVEAMSGATTEARTEAIAKRRRAEEEQRFDLKHGRMLRASLLRLDQEEHILLLTVHHVASDGWSARLLWRELALLYGAFSRREERPLPDLAVRYTDYSVWQRQHVAGERLHSLLQFWQRQLNGIAPLKLPTDRPRPARPSYRGAQQDFQLGSELIGRLRRLGQGEGATLHMTLLAALQVVLARYSGQDDIAVGTPTAGRHHEALEDMIGCFMNTLVIRTDLSGDPTFRELLGRVRRVSLDAYDHQDLPFEKLVEEMRPERQANLNPLVQVLFQLMNFSEANLTLPDLQVHRLPDVSERSRLDLEFYLWQNGDTAKGTLTYSTDLFDESTIGRLIEHFVTLLEAVATDADRCIGELPLLAPAERRKLLEEWNDTQAAYPRERCVHQLFEEQAARTPNSTAVVFEKQRLSYDELNRAANRVAHGLRARGIGPGAIVGVALKRGTDLVAALLGILKTGAAYLPLDPAFPAERLEFMRADSRMQLTIDGVTTISSNNEENPTAAISPAGTAYVLYTSGSTGLPKGTVIPHRALCNFVSAMARIVNFDWEDCWLATTTISFDIAAAELFVPLLAGGRVEIAGEGISTDGEALAALLESSGATHWQATPSGWQLLIASGWQGLRHLHAVCGGEELRLDLAQKIRARVALLWNMYGPTETTIWSTFSEVARDAQKIHIGRPLANTRVYILDERLEPQPAGVAGDLYIGGDGVASGYLHRAELTAQRFVRDPFGAADQTIYRTGDVARFLADGDIEFLGRKDDQVKIRGHRIEMGEIEAALKQQPGVSASVVTARDDGTGNQQLVAYLVGEGDLSTGDSAGIRETLRQKLPQYMIPSAFVWLGKLPLTPNGKIDRKALPAPEVNDQSHAESYKAPGTALEVHLVHIWESVLGISGIGIEDDFFELGGHSLLAIRLIAEMDNAFNIRLTVPAFLQNATIAGITSVIRQGQPVLAEAKTIRLRSRNTQGTVFFVAAGVALCQLAHLLEGGPAFYATVSPPFQPKILAAAARDDRAALPSLEKLAAAHAELVRREDSSGPCVLVGYSFGGLLAFEVAHQLQQQGRSVEMIFLFDTWGRPSPLWQKLRKLPVTWAQEWAKERAKQSWSKMRYGVVKRVARHAPSSWAQTTPPEFEESHFSLGHEPWSIVTKLNRYAQKKYRYRPLDTRAILFRSLDSDLAPLHSVDGQMGWGGLFSRGLEIVNIPGDHLSLMRDPHIRELAVMVNDRLQEISGGRSIGDAVS